MFNSEDYFWDEYDVNVGVIDDPIPSETWPNDDFEGMQQPEDPWLAPFPQVEGDYWSNDLDFLEHDENSNLSMPKQTDEFPSIPIVEVPSPATVNPPEILAEESSNEVEVVAQSYVYASKSGRKSQIVVTKQPGKNGFASLLDVRVYGDRNSPRPNRNVILPHTTLAPIKPPVPGQKRCSCTKSHCLKMYCECFSLGRFCVNCGCKDCGNTLGSTYRKNAVKESLERNPIAFRPKIGVTGKGKSKVFRFHQKGCRCKKSNCLKNYCECYEARVGCTERCTCVGCKNQSSVPNHDESSDDESETGNQIVELETPWNFLSDGVIEAATECLLISYNNSKGQGNSSNEALTDVFNEFGTCMKHVFTASKLGHQGDSG